MKNKRSALNRILSGITAALMAVSMVQITPINVFAENNASDHQTEYVDNTSVSEKESPDSEETTVIVNDDAPSEDDYSDPSGDTVSNPSTESSAEADLSAEDPAAQGKFALLAVNEESILIDPVYVEYAEGDSVLDALEKTEYDFVFSDDGYEIYSVQGETASYLRYYDNGGYALTGSASGITALYITTNADTLYSDSYISLVNNMAEFYTASDERKSYTPLADAVEAALNGFYNADSEKAEQFDQAIEDAKTSYDAYLNRSVVDVSLNITKAGQTVIPHLAVFTDEYGIKKEVSNLSSISLGIGTYTFDISDETDDHVSGSFIVSEENTTLTAELPSDNWVSSVDFGISSGWTSESALREDVISSKEITIYVPDYAGTNLYPCFTPASGVSTSLIACYLEGESVKKTWNSHSASFSGIIEKDSLTGKTIYFQARQNESADQYGYLQYQNYTVHIKRIPSLAGLAVYEGNTALPLSFDSSVKEYTVSTIKDTVEISAEALCPDTAVSVNGVPVVSGELTAVDLKDCTSEDGKYVITMETSSSGVSDLYYIYVEKIESVSVTIDYSEGDELELYNSADSIVEPVSSSGQKKVYALISGETYRWVTTKDIYFHAEAEFTAAAGLSVTALSPKTVDWLTEFAARSSNSSSSATVYGIAPAFNTSLHAYTLSVGSTMGAMYVHAAPLNTSLYTATVYYKTYSGNEKTVKPSASSYTNLLNLITASGVSTEFRLEIRQNTDEDGVSYYQDYTFCVNRLMQLAELGVSSAGGKSYSLTQDNDSGAAYNRNVLDYKTSIAQSTESILVNFKELSTNMTGDYDASVTICTDDFSKEITFDQANPPTVTTECSVPLDPEKSEETITITVDHKDTASLEQTYRIRIIKLSPVKTSITVTPGSALVFLRESQAGNRVLPDEDGLYLLDNTAEYKYNITCSGYKGISGTFTAGDTNKDLIFTLETAPETEFTDISGEDDWPSYRGNSDNNAVTDAPIPTSSDDSVLMWASKIGDGFSGGATGCPILVGGYLYTYAGQKIYKVDKETGEIAASGTMAGSSSFAINPPTYADGMLFVGLSNGRVQAFNAETLESLWIYQDELGGQPNCQITYYNGYVYTGFWNSETSPANYVCLSATDEDPNNTLEEKTASWTYTDKGFYWSGAYISDGMLLITTEDGESGVLKGHGSVLSLDPLTGEVKSDMEVPYTGDLRSSICYDEATDAFYFTSRGGYFYQFKVNEDGSIDETSLRSITLDNGKADPSNPGMSLSTPVIYNGRAYVGVSGTGQYSPYTGHNITVIDLESFKVAYQVPTQGYPQASGILTTAYENDTEYVYVYFFDNYTPGKLRVIRDKAGQTEIDHDYSSVETYTVSGKEMSIETGRVLFTPSGSQAQYCICSPIVDSEGNIYFKNDSAQLMKVSSTISKITVTDDTAVRKNYCVGETFDGSGLKVSAEYSNGVIKDISEHLGYSDEKLTVDDKEIMISYDLDSYLSGSDGNWQLYQDGENGAGSAWNMPYTMISINVYAEHTDDDKDGYCDRCGVSTADDLSKAEITLKDAEYIYTGKAIEPEITVLYADKVLVQDTDYTVSYADNINAGTALVTVKGTGDYAGTQTKTFTIGKAEQSLTAEISASSIAYGEAGTITAKGTGTITYKSSDTSVAVVSKKGVVTGKGTGTAAITVTAAGDVNHNAAEAKINVTVYIKAPALSSVSNDTKGILLTWTKTDGAVKYQIYRSSDKGVSFSRIKTLTVSDILSYTDTTAAAGTEYQYKIRAYSGNAYSKYSSAKTIVRLAGPTVSSYVNSVSGITIKWAKADGAASYYIYRSINGGKAVKIAVSKKCSYCDTTGKAANGDQVIYTVCSCKTASDGNVSMSKGTATPSIYRIARPTNVKAKLKSASGTKYIYVSWKEAAWTANAGKESTGYYIYRSINGGSYKLVKTITSGDVKYYKDRSVTSGKKYSYKVYAFKTNGKTTSKSAVSSASAVITVK